MPFSDRPARSDFAALIEQPAQERPARTERSATVAEKPAAPAADASPLKKVREEIIAAVEADAPPEKERIDKKKSNQVAMESFRIEVGHDHGIKPANIVGAIANEAGLEAKYIGRIEIFDRYSLLDLPAGMPDEVFQQLSTVAIGANKLRISHSGVRPAEDRPMDKRVTLAAPSKGGDRRVAEKGRNTKPVSKRVAVASGKSYDAPRSPSKPSTGPSGKPVIKLHRKGGKPG